MATTLLPLLIRAAFSEAHAAPLSPEMLCEALPLKSRAHTFLHAVEDAIVFEIRERERS
jgi:hypothetical protein